MASAAKKSSSPSKSVSGADLRERIDLVEGTLTSQMEKLEEREGSLAGQVRQLEKRLRAVENLLSPLLTAEEEMSASKWVTKEVLEDENPR